MIYTICKSHVSVNHLHFHIQTFYTYTYPVAVYIYIYIYIYILVTQGRCKYLSNTLTQPYESVLGPVSVNTKIIRKVTTLSLGLLSPQALHLVVSIK